jgi:hypothetical protein
LRLSIEGAQAGRSRPGPRLGSRGRIRLRGSPGQFPNWRQRVAVPDESLLAHHRAVGPLDPLVHTPAERVVAVGDAAAVGQAYLAQPVHA